LSSEYHIFLAEFLGHIYEERHLEGKYNPQIKEVIMHHFDAATRLDNKWDHPFRAYGNWLFSFAESEEACNNADLLKQTIDLAVLMYKEAIKRNNALFLEAMEKYNAFTNNYDELKKIIPEVPDLYYSFAKYLQKIDLWEINEDNFYHDIQSHTDRFPLYRAVVEYLCQKQRFAEGVYVLKEYLEYAPDDANTHLLLGNVLFYNLHNKEEGIQKIGIAVKLRPEDINILFSYGKMLFFSEEYEKSIDTLKRVISVDAKRHDAYFLIAQSYERLLKMREAEDAYESSVSLNPNSTEYKKHLARLRIELKIISQETSSASSQ
jgi:tetratricopeptide (TPR) repeat protein